MIKFTAALLTITFVVGAIETKRDSRKGSKANRKLQTEATVAQYFKHGRSSKSDDDDDLPVYNKILEVTNLAYQQPFGPFFVMSHTEDVPPIYTLGQPATDALAILAETGDPGPLVELYSEQDGVFYANAVTEGVPFLVGGNFNLTIPFAEGFDRFTIASMAINTNDCFVALSSRPLTRENRNIQVPGLDAGSEENNEDCDSIPGPACPEDSGNERSGNGEGVVHVHRGVFGIGDLTKSVYDWRNPMMMVSVADTVLVEPEEELYDVCVVGAGPSGVTAAYTASQQGKSVVVLEKNDYVGGKTKVVVYDGLEYRIGATAYVPARSPNPIIELSEIFGIYESPLMNPVLYFLDEARFPPPPPSSELIEAIQTYAELRSKFDPLLNNVEGYLSDYPDELNYMSFAQWLANNNISALEPVFWIYVTAYGYGLTMETPAIYVLKYMPSSMFLSFIQRDISTYPFMELLNAMALTLEEPVRLNANIKEVEYNDDFNKIIYDDPSGYDNEVNCRSTIIAFPPISDGMELFTPTKEHERLFSKVKHRNYYTSLVRPESGEFGDSVTSYFHVHTHTSLPDVPILNAKFYDGNSTPIVSFLASSTDLREEDAIAATVNGLSRFSGATVTGSQILDFNDWVYFPHFDNQDLKDGAFQDFEDLQGANNQYYSGGMYHFEIVQDAMAHGKHIVNKFL